MRRTRIPALILSQPFEFWVSFSMLFMGIQSILRNEADLSELFARTLTRLLLLAWEFGIILAGLCIIASFVLSPAAARRGEATKARNRGVEKVGLILMATSTSAYITALAIVAGGSAVFSIGILSGVILAAVTRLWALRRIDRATLYYLRRANEGLA